MYRVSDHTKFAIFDYNSHPIDTHQLGDIVIKGKGTSYPEIGVVIQTHKDGDMRTDMFGNCSPCEVQPATLYDMLKHRPELSEDLS